MIYKMMMLCLILLASAGSVSAVDMIQTELKAEQWDMPRQGERILRSPALNHLLKQWQQQSHKLIEIRYPGGEEGELWVNELMDWLVALGVPSEKLHAVQGSGAEDKIQLLIIDSP